MSTSRVDRWRCDAVQWTKKRPFDAKSGWNASPSDPPSPHTDTPEIVRNGEGLTDPFSRMRMAPVRSGMKMRPSPLGAVSSMGALSPLATALSSSGGMAGISASFSHSPSGSNSDPIPKESLVTSNLPAISHHSSK